MDYKDYCAPPVERRDVEIEIEKAEALLLEQRRSGAYTGNTEAFLEFSREVLKDFREEEGDGE